MKPLLLSDSVSCGGPLAVLRPKEHLLHSPKSTVSGMTWYRAVTELTGWQACGLTPLASCLGLCSVVQFGFNAGLTASNILSMVITSQVSVHPWAVGTLLVAFLHRGLISCTDASRSDGPIWQEPLKILSLLRL